MRLPFFPLHLVAFPHLPLPLHIFEERYRAMARDILADGSPYAGRFVVSMLTSGQEAGDDAAIGRAVGTICEVRTAEQLPDGSGCSRGRRGAGGARRCGPQRAAYRAGWRGGGAAPRWTARVEPTLLPARQAPALDGYMAHREQ